MKKVTKSLFLAVAVLALSSCIGNFQQGGSMTKTGSIVDRDTAHAIEVLKDEQVTVDAPSSAKAGDKVEFTLDYDEESYVLEKVTVNDELPAYVEGEGFYFVMPEEDVTITIAGHVIEHEEEKTTYRVINNYSYAGILFNSEKDLYESGENVTLVLSFAFATPYSFTGKARAYTANGYNTVPVEVKGDTLTFVMPEDDVLIKLELETNYYQFVVSDTTYLKGGSAYNSIHYLDGESWVAADYQVRDGKYLYYFQFDAKVRLSLRSTDTFIVNGAELTDAYGGKQKVNVDENNYAYFTMPMWETTFDVFGAVNYKTVEVVSADHNIATLCQKVNDEYVPLDLTKVLPTSVVYVKVDNVEGGEDYIVRNVNVTNGQTAVTVTADVKGSLYHFTMPNSDAVTVAVEEVYAIYRDYSFADSYFYGANIYGTSAGAATAGTSYSVYAASDGTVTFRGKDFTIDTATVKTGDGLMTMTDGAQISYSDKFMLTYYNSAASNMKLANAYGKDYAVMVKMQEPTDTAGMYTFKYNIDNGKNYVAVQAYRSGQLYASMFFDTVRKEFMSSEVSFAFAQGENVGDSTSIFNVMNGETAVGRVNNRSYRSFDRTWKAVTANSAEHNSASLQILDMNDDYVATTLDQVPVGETVRIAITNTDSNYLAEVNVKNGSSSVTVTTITSGELYSFVMPDSDDVVINVTEVYAAYRNYSFVGAKYYGANLYGNNKAASASLSSSYWAEITGDGKVSWKSSNNFTIATASSVDGDGLITTTDGAQISYGGRFLFSYYGTSAASMNLANAYGKDYGVMVRMQEPTDTTGMYTFYYKIDSLKSYIAVEAYRNGEFYAAMFFDTVKCAFFASDLEFQFTSGTKVSDSGAAFNVVNNGETIATISGNDYVSDIHIYKSVTLQNTDNNTGSLLIQEGEEWVNADPNSIEVGTTVRVAITGSNPEVFGATVAVAAGSASVTVTTITENELYSFVMPNMDDVTVAIKDLRLSYDGFSFVGTFKGANLYGSKSETGKGSSSSYSGNIATNGQITMSGSAKTKITEASNEGTGDGFASLANGKDMCYSDLFLFAHYSFNYGISGAYGNDYLVAVMCQSTDTVKFNYLVKSGAFIAVEALINDATAGYMFFDCVNHEFYAADVSFALTSGTTFASTSAVFDVKVGDATIGTVNANTYNKA